MFREMMGAFPPTAGDVLVVAAAYLEHGWSVIPLEPGGVKPTLKWEAFQNRHATPAELEDWARQWPGMNLGLVTGEISQSTVVDVDGPDGAAAARALPHELPHTLTQRTPRGWHLVYQYATGVRNTATPQGIDIRGDGGYIVVSPSSRLPTESKPGGVYSWKRLIEPAAFPLWVLDNLKPDRKSAKSDGTPEQPSWVSYFLEHGAKRGERNQAAARLSGYFFGLGTPDDITLRILEPFAAKCQPPFDEVELQRVIASTSRYRKQAEQAGVTPAPTRVKTLMGERYTFEDESITVDLSSVRADGDAYIAELSVFCDLPSLPSQLHGPVRFNMMSTQVRSQVAKYLGARLPINWNDLLEVTCRLAVESARYGEPPIKLRDAPRSKAGIYAIDPLLLLDAPTIWFAKGGSFKSYFALAAAATLEGHEAIPGLHPTRLMHVAYLDWEWDAAVHGERLRLLIGEAAAESCEILYRRCHGPLSDQVDSLKRMIDAEGVQFLIFDSLGMACKGEPESAAAALDFSQAVRALGLGSLWISHVTKNGDVDMPFGSSYWHNTARSTWYVQKDEETGELGFFMKKANQGKWAKPLGFSIDFSTDPERVLIERTGFHSAELMGRMSMPARIREILRLGPKSVDELVTLLDTKKATVQTRLSEMKLSGQVVNVGGGQWVLLHKESR